MQMAELFEKAISSSEYAGDFEYNKLLRHVYDNRLYAIAAGEYNEKSIILVFVKGEAEGAAQIDEFGMLYGDKVIYSLNKSGTYKLFISDKTLVESLASRTRIFDTKYIKPETFSPEIRDLKSFSTRPSKLRIVVLKDGSPATGLKVVMKKDNAPFTYDFTSSDGSAGFVLQGGEYHCTVIEPDGKEQIFLIKLEGKDTVITIKI